MGFRIHIILVMCALLSLSQTLSAQRLAVKTNLLYDAALSPNLGLEAAVAPRWTIDLSGNLNAWNFSDNRKWKHYLIQPEVRYWLCESFNGHFFGLHLHGGAFNFGNVDTVVNLFGDTSSERHEGWYYGAGLSYGYQWLLSRRWNLELSLGVGYVGSDYDVYECAVCGDHLGRAHHDYFGITKASVSLIFLIF